MLTPIFSITQDRTHLFIKIKAPNARVSQTEIHIEEQDFRFFSKPYYLRLSLPSKVVEDGKELADYDSLSGTFLIKVSKLNAGQHFEGLDLLTKLLSNNKQLIKKPLIEVIDEQQDSTQTINTLESIDEDFDWNFDQTLRQESDELLLFGQKYGFADQYSGVVARIAEEFCDLIEIKDPEHKNYPQRREERLQTEANHFSDDHYLSDKFDQKVLISHIISHNIFDLELNKEFDDEHRFRLKNLPKKEYLFDKSTKKRLLLSMIDILFGFAYDMRINEWETNVESGWTITKLSATLSWFDSYSSLREVVIASIRRSLCYPLYREWNLSLKVFEDMINILKLGQNYVLKCFLDIHKIFNESGDGRYLLNDIFITDYCVWIQYLKPQTFESLVRTLQTIRINKSDVDLDLGILERAANLAIQEQKDCPSDSQYNEFVNQKHTEKEDIDSDDDSPPSECSEDHPNDSLNKS